MGGRRWRDVLGLSHSAGGVTSGVVGLAIVPLVAWLPGGWPLGLVAAGLLAGFAVDTVIQTSRSRSASDSSEVEMPPVSARTTARGRISADLSRLFLNFGAALAFTAAGLWLASQSDGPSRAVALLFGAFFGVAALIMLWFIGASRRLFLQVDDSGILESTRPPRRANCVKWQDVASVELKTGAQGYVLIHLRDGGDPVFVQTVFLKGGARAVCQAVESHPKCPR